MHARGGRTSWPRIRSKSLRRIVIQIVYTELNSLMKPPKLPQSISCLVSYSILVPAAGDSVIGTREARPTQKNDINPQTQREQPERSSSCGPTSWKLGDRSSRRSDLLRNRISSGCPINVFGPIAENDLERLRLVTIRHRLERNSF